MNTIAERVKFLRKDILHLTQQEFADAINISRSNMANVETDRIAATDRTISDICREFGVSEHWLRTGEGDMLQPMSKDEELAAFFGDVLSDSDPFKKAFLSALAKLDVDEWKLLANIAMKTVENIRSEESDLEKKSEP